VDVQKWRATRAWHRVELRGHSGSVDYAAFTADGRHVLTVDGGRTLRLWDPATGFALLTFRTAADTSVVAPSPAGDLVVTALRSNHLATVWSVANGERRTDLLGHSGPVSCAGWSGTATRVITASWDGSARVWDVASGRNLAEFPGHGSQYKRVCPSLSPDGALALVGGSDDVVRVWNVAQRHLVLELRGHTRGLNSVAWSADGALIVTSGNDSLVRVWEALSGRVVKEVPMRYQRGRGALSTDKHWLITTGGDNLRVWALETGLEISVVGGHASLINDANWSADGAAIVTGGSDGVAIVHPWELFAPFESVLGAACNRVTGNMTHAEWERYMGSTRYRATCPSRPVPEALSGR
jgi:WD40 repeat protein